MNKAVKRAVLAAMTGLLMVVTVYEGRVLFGNEQGPTELRAGDIGRAHTGEAPTRDALPPAAEQRAEAPLPRAPRRFASPDERTALSRAIEQARKRRAAAAAEASAPAAPPSGVPATWPVGELDKDYIRERVRDVLPLMVECYTMSLEDVPDLAGKLVAEFVISGEPEIGGLVEDAIISDEESTIAHPGMRECMRETLYSIEFAPPPEGGKIVVRYPFEFRPDDSGDDLGEAQRIELRGDE